DGHKWPPLQLNAFLALAISWLARRRFVCHLDSQRSRILGVLTRELVRDLIQQIGCVAKLEEKLDAGEVDPPRLREISDRAHSVEVVVRIQADVRVRPYRIEQSLFLVDSERPGMAARQTRRDADDVHGSPLACHADI